MTKTKFPELNTEVVLVDGIIGHVQETIGDITNYDLDYSLLDEHNFLHLTNEDNKTVCIALSQIQTMTDIRNL